MTTTVLSLRIVRVGIAIVAAACLAGLSACQPTGDAVAIDIDDDDIGGVVTGPDGPEAGVWVIAETTDLPTKLNKIVVTDDAGRYVLPDLPDATYGRVGARLRAGRFSEGPGHARRDSRSWTR